MMTSKSKSATNQQAQVLTIGTHTNKNACSTKRLLIDGIKEASKKLMKSTASAQHRI